MDPNITLDSIRALVISIHEAENPDDVDELAEKLATDIRALDEWLTSGGFLPKAWQ